MNETGSVTNPKTNKKGLSILLSSDIKSEDISRLSVTNGVSLVKSSSFMPDSFVPNESWQVFDKTQTHLQFNTCAGTPHNTICLFSIPSDLKSAFQDLSLNTLKSQDQIAGYLIEQKSKISFFDSCMNSFLKKFEFIDSKMHGIFIIAPKLSSVGYSTGAKKYIGMHLDNSVSGSLADLLSTGKNRISINLGLEDRYLTFVNLELSTICEMVNSKNK